MKNFPAINNLSNNQIQPNLSIQNLTENRVEALKALITLIMQELESFQKLTSRSINSTESENISFQDEVEEFEIELIRTALIQTRGHQRNAANMLGLKNTTLNAKMKRYRIDPRTFLI